MDEFTIESASVDSTKVAGIIDRIKALEGFRWYFVIHKDISRDDMNFLLNFDIHTAASYLGITYDVYNLEIGNLDSEFTGEYDPAIEGKVVVACYADLADGAEIVEAGLEIAVANNSKLFEGTGCNAAFARLRRRSDIFEAEALNVGKLVEGFREQLPSYVLSRVIEYQKIIAEIIR